MKGMAFVLAGLLSICLAASALAKHHEVKVAEKAGIGKYLTDAEGKTLYFFKNDAPGKSACTGDCLARWPVYFRATVAPPASLATQDFGTLKRSDGQSQTTFRGYPLYYWVGDTAAGDTNGQGVMERWSVVDPEHFPPR